MDAADIALKHFALQNMVGHLKMVLEVRKSEREQMTYFLKLLQELCLKM